METVAIDNSLVIKKSLHALVSGGVILYPTDTVYGLGADATSPEAVKKIIDIKRREEDKTFLVMVHDIKMLKKYAEVSTTAEHLVHEFLPGALTLVLTAKGGDLKGVQREDGSIGFRIPNHSFCLELTKYFLKPIVSTSANTSGAVTPKNITDVLGQLGKDSRQIDMAVDGGSVQKNVPSTIVDARNEKITILREGAVSKELLTTFL